MNKFCTGMVACVMGVACLGSVSAQQPYSYGVGTRTVRFDTTRHSEARARLNELFPRLGEDYEVLEPPTDKYAAFQHVWGNHSRQAYLKIASEASPLSLIDSEFRKSGYTRLPRFDSSLVPGKQKAILFCTLAPDGTIAEIKSAALQEADGTWTMKIGKLSLVRFRNLEQLRGLTYGVATSAYIRTRPVAPKVIRKPAPAFDPSILDINR